MRGLKLHGSQMHLAKLQFDKREAVKLHFGKPRCDNQLKHAGTVQLTAL
jgi:hypothetical protein